VSEETKDLVAQLIKRLETSSEIIEDLKTVLDQVGIDYDVNTITKCYVYSAIKHIMRGYSIRLRLWGAPGRNKTLEISLHLG
jgi:hypothetical protein